MWLYSEDVILLEAGPKATALLKRFAMKYYPNEQLADEEIEHAGKAVQMFEIENRTSHRQRYRSDNVLKQLMNNPIKHLTKRMGFMARISAHSNSSNTLTETTDLRTLIAACIRDHIIDFTAKGNVWAPHLDDPVQYSVWHYLMEIFATGVK